jgi:hypothetical protein
MPPTKHIISESFIGFVAELHSLCDLQSFYHSILIGTWIDERTRSLSVEYSAYALHSQTFAANSLAFDVSPEGNVKVLWHLELSFCIDVFACTAGASRRARCAAKQVPSRHYHAHQPPHRKTPRLSRL